MIFLRTNGVREKENIFFLILCLHANKPVVRFQCLIDSLSIPLYFDCFSISLTCYRFSRIRLNN